MGISMVDCLSLPSFQGAEVISGEDRLSHGVNNISVLEILNEEQIDYLKESLNGFEIYLTSFSGISDNIQAQCEVIELLANKGNVSLVIYYLGSVVKDLHPDVISTARQLGLPLVIMPAGRLDLKYRDAIQEVSSLLLEEQLRKEESYKDLAVLLSKIPESNRSFAKLLKTISDLKMVNLLLSDVSYLNTMQSSYINAKPFDYCTIIDIFSKNCSDNSDHMVVSEFEGHKINIFRIRLKSHSFRYFYLYIIDDSESLTLDDARQITEIVELFSEVWNLSKEEISSQSILTALDDNNIERLRAISKRYDLNLEKPGTLFLIHPNIAENPAYNTVSARLQLRENISQIVKDSQPYVLFNTYGKYFVLFIKEDLDESLDTELFEAMSDALKSCNSSITEIHASLKDIRGILPLYDAYFTDMEKILPKQKRYTLSDIFFACSCRRVIEINGPDKTILDSVLSKVDNLPDAQDLLDTLSTFYLDTDCEINLTADILYIHRNTVKYRLKKAYTILQLTTYHTKSSSFMQLLLGYYRLLH